ncbi:MAG: hypothetical protein K2X03_01400 [Bryobacteraceae bacterium]|nr:hypothetical protein [Bryobacteraceae bacterium]
MSDSWLPPLVLLADFGGDWATYERVVYGWFKQDFLASLPSWPGKRVGVKRIPLSEGKEATYWHFISEGKVEEERIIDLRRCERIRWPRPTMDAFVERRPLADDPIVWWRTKRGSEWRYVLALPDFSYLVVVADRGDYVLPWTQYPIDRPHQREKYRKEFTEYWAAQKG